MAFIRKKGKYFVIVETREGRQIVLKHLGTIENILGTYELAESVRKAKLGTLRDILERDSS